jgi:predicted ATPase
LVSGEPGIGKSRLAQTLLERLAGEQHTRLRSFCSPHHRDHALYPTITQLERAAGFRREDSAAQRFDKLEGVLARATNDLGEAAPLLAALLSLPIGGRYTPLELSPQKQKERTLRSLVAQVEGLAVRRPVLMLFEDAQWSDPTSLELLDLIIDRAPALPLLLIVTFRPEFSAPWIGRPHVTTLSLNRLPPRQRAEMIVGVTGGKTLPDGVAAQIVERTDGVPLFVEELTKAVVESGTLTDLGDHYAATGPMPALAIPASLQASLLARLDRLAPVREVAQIGAALGRRFSHELIAAVGPMPSRELDNALAQLVGAELIYRRGTPPDAEYTFKHALVQDAAYSTLLRGPRQQLHARIAGTLEVRFQEITAAQPALLAHHCTEAGLTERAVGYLLKAGRQAVARAVMTEAVAQLRKGLDLLGTLPDSLWRQQQELDLQVALGPALFATRGFGSPDVGRTLARGLALVEQLDQPDYLAPLLYGQWVFHNARADYNLALSFAERMEKVGEARGDDAARLLGHFVQGLTRHQLGEITSARALCEESHGLSYRAHRAVYAAVTAEDPHVVMTGVLALALTNLGYVDQGCEKIDEALAEARRLDNASTLALALLYACRVAMSVASPHEVLRHAKEAEALSTVHSLPLYSALGSIYCG